MSEAPFKESVKDDIDYKLKVQLGRCCSCWWRTFCWHYQIDALFIHCLWSKPVFWRNGNPSKSDKAVILRDFSRNILLDDFSESYPGVMLNKCRNFHISLFEIYERTYDSTIFCNLKAITKCFTNSTLNLRLFQKHQLRLLNENFNLKKISCIYKLTVLETKNKNDLQSH